MDAAALLGLMEPFSIAITLLIMGLISKRLGEQTKARPYYLGFYIAAILLEISIVAQLLDLAFDLPHAGADTLWVILDDGLPALAVTLGVISAWRYWSWLLAERD